MHRSPLAAVVPALLAVAAVGQAVPHWAFVPPQRHVPAIDDPWCRDDLDRIVLANLRAHGLGPAPAVDRELLLRRAHLVLTGLPPTLAEVEAFLADRTDDAYERVVDDLVRRESCAEHLATPWLDLARFADTYGFQSDFECRTWPWRDWLLHAIADDLPFDRFVAELLAGDLLPDATVATRTATAFWRLHRQTNEGGSIDEEWRHEYIADRVDTFGATFLGLTLGCARCHDHKYDPITQRDYYSLGSFFAVDENGLYPYTTGATPPPTVRLTTPAQEAELARLQRAVEAATVAYANERELRADQPHRVQVPVPIASVRWDRVESSPTDRVHRLGALPANLRTVEAPDGRAVECDGDTRLPVADLPPFTRDDDFSVRLRLWCPDTKGRAVLWHTSSYTEDADAQGHQLLLKDGRLCWEIVHCWPGSAAAVRATAPLPLQRWVDVVVTYDGSSTAIGMQVYVDGLGCETEVVRDELDGVATARQLELGGRDRDQGFAGGRFAQFEVFDHALSSGEIAALARLPGLPQVERTRPWDHPAVKGAAAALRAARAALHEYQQAIPELMVMARNPHPPARCVLRRGAYDQPDAAQPVTAATPRALWPLGMNGERDRLLLAAWIADARNPLTPRVMVDRLWAQCFGQGLVRTPDNFGMRGTPPAQQDLLDTLAFDFARDRSTKHLLRRIVLSATFRQSSAADAAAREQDPYGELLARGPSFRLSAEALRDQALQASGLLRPRFGGPSVRPWQPPSLWRDAGVGWGGADYKPDTGDDAHRRSLYTFRKRTAPPPDMLTLDGTSREVCTVRRAETDTPLQALVVLDDPVFTECAAVLAQQALALPHADAEARLQFVFASLATRRARDPELAALRALLTQDPDPLRAMTLVASTVMASDAVMVLR